VKVGLVFLGVKVRHGATVKFNAEMSSSSILPTPAQTGKESMVK
jgi:hypothetical protein